ncbi:MAG TPA: LysR family transcriptional regulator, partial [Firmicutes bacterium]|nr:LysR family transcriptional regulator [Bacillota bacterium]
MNIEWLQTFVETVRTSSITKAATNLHLTQPAVSMQLQNLERTLDSELLIRSNKGVQMTDAGRVLFSYAQSFITLADNLRQDLDNLKNDTREVLSIGT